MRHIDACQNDAYNNDISGKAVNVSVKTPREWLLAARKKKCMTQETVANNVGITRTTYARYESGERTPTPSIAEKISKFLGINKEYFFWPPQYHFDAKNKEATA